jgi:hypothetical protein
MQNEQNQQLLSTIATSKDLPLYLEVNKIKELRIPRCYLQPKDNNDSSKVELHIFCDPSPSAYAAVAYWRFIQYCADQSANVFVSFISSKSRVAPVKTVPIPRFELQGALLASRIATVIQDDHNIKPVERYFWTDYTTVLHWLRNENRNDIDTLTKIKEAETLLTTEIITK